MQIVIFNTSKLDISGLEDFSCKDYLPTNIYTNPTRGVNAFNKNTIFINQHPNGFIERQFCKLSLTGKNNDSLLLNIEPNLSDS